MGALGRGLQEDEPDYVPSPISNEGTVEMGEDGRPVRGKVRYLLLLLLVLWHLRFLEWAFAIFHLVYLLAYSRL